jgi:ATP-dependent RNA helicase MSS116
MCRIERGADQREDGGRLFSYPLSNGDSITSRGRVGRARRTLVNEPILAREDYLNVSPRPVRLDSQVDVLLNFIHGIGALTRSTVGTLVISPTRELATQIANESIKCHTWHKLYMTQLLVGGSSRRHQIRLWKKDRKDVVVATPGRLKDLLQDPEVGQDFADALAHTGTLVLDEADTLLDMGFANDLNFIISHLPKERQTMLFSATVSPAIRKIARASLEKDHLFIDCVPENESNVHEHIPQYHTVLPTAGDQLPHVLRLLAHDQLMNPQQSKSIVFLPTLKLTQLFATFVRELSEALPHGKRTSVYEIHSKLDQDKRSRASDRFRKDTSPASILVTSDVSARGVDYPGVTRVIQIGVPSSGEQYIHRVGRTGRGGVQGGRGDLVLLPWESRFLESLNEVPIKPAKPDALKEEIEGLAQAWDQNLPEFQIRSVTPSQYGRNRSAPPATRTLTAEPYSERLEKMPEYINELLSGIDEEAIYSTFTSMLGYYIGKQDVVQISPRSILTGLQSWAVQAGGLDAPPTVSSTMLAKLGFKGDKPSGGRGGGGRGGYSGGRGGYSGGRDGQRRDAGSSNYGMRRMHTVARPGLGRRYLTISAVRRNESVPEVKENRQSDAVARTFSFLKLDLAPEEFEAKGDHSRQDEPARPIVFNKSGNQYSGRSIEAREGNFIGAYRRLSGILSRNRVRKELRLNEYHEKGSEMKRRLKSERHRRRFQDLVC